MTTGGKVDAIRAAVVALNSGDIDGYFRFFDPSCKRWVAGFEQPLTLADIRNGLHHLRGAFESLYLEEDLLFGDPQFVCARWRLRGTHVGEYLGVAPTRRQIDTQTCEVYEFRGNLVVATWTYGDPGQLLRQISAVEGGETK